MSDDLAQRREQREREQEKADRPHIPCPECGEVWLQTLVCIVNDRNEPRATSYVPAVRCSACGHEFDISTTHGSFA